MAETVPGLSAGVSRLWRAAGVAGSSGAGSPGADADRRPARAALTTDRIVAAAVELADAEGLDSVSMARVADRLGAGTMSLYRHVAGKDELLLLMHDSVWRMQADPSPADTSQGWRPALEAWCRWQHDTLAAHPWLERIRFVERAGTPSQMVALERALAILAATPLSEPAKVAALMMLNGYLLWQARYDEELRTAATAVQVPVEDVTGQFGVLMTTLTASGRFPALARAVAGGAFAPGSATVGDFEWGLGFLLDGIETLVAQA